MILSDRSLGRVCHSLGMRAPFFSFAALIIACIALIHSRKLPPDRPGKGMSAYDFSTPEAGFISNLRIAADGDEKALWELSNLDGLRRDMASELRSYNIQSYVDFKGERALFYSFNDTNGHIHYAVAWMKPTNGTWDIVNHDPDLSSDPKLQTIIFKWNGLNIND